MEMINKLPQDDPVLKTHKTTIYNTLGLIYHRKGDYEKAIDYYNQSLTLLEQNTENKYNSKTGITYYNLGSVYFEMKDFHNAFDYLKKAENILLTYRSPYLGQIYKQLIEVCRNLGDEEDSMKYSLLYLRYLYNPFMGR